MDSLPTPSLGHCLSRAHRKDDREATCLIGNNFNPVGESSHSPIVCVLPFQTRGLARISARLMTPWTATSKTITWEGPLPISSPPILNHYDHPQGYRIWSPQQVDQVQLRSRNSICARMARVVAHLYDPLIKLQATIGSTSSSETTCEMQPACMTWGKLPGQQCVERRTRRDKAGAYESEWIIETQTGKWDRRVDIRINIDYCDGNLRICMLFLSAEKVKSRSPRSWWS